MTVTVGDGTGSVDVGFTWTVADTDHHPVAKVDYVTVEQDQIARIQVLANDAGLEDGGLSLTIRPDAQPLHGLANVEGLAVVYLPDAGFAGQDSCIYRVQDADGDRAEASVMIQVLCTTCPDGRRILLWWDPNRAEEAVAGYRLFMGYDAATADTEIADISVTADGFDPSAPSLQYDSGLDFGLHAGERACFRLKAYNRFGESGFSKAACTTL